MSNKIIRDTVKRKFDGLCAYTGKPLGDDWQIDHVTPKYRESLKGYEKFNSECISNKYPAISIVNHYKRSLDLEQFREYMKSFHLRLAKLPKTTKSEKTKKRIIYMRRIATLFDINIDTPFSGEFYFEKLVDYSPFNRSLNFSKVLKHTTSESRRKILDEAPFSAESYLEKYKQYDLDSYKEIYAREQGFSSTEEYLKNALENDFHKAIEKIENLFDNASIMLIHHIQETKRRSLIREKTGISPIALTLKDLNIDLQGNSEGKV